MGIKISYNIHITERLKLLLLNLSLLNLALCLVQLRLQIHFSCLCFIFFRFFFDWLGCILQFFWGPHIRRSIFLNLNWRRVLFFLYFKRLSVFKCILFGLLSITTFIIFLADFILWYKIILLSKLSDFLFFCFWVTFLKSFQKIIKVFKTFLNLLFHWCIFKSRFLRPTWFGLVFSLVRSWSVNQFSDKLLSVLNWSINLILRNNLIVLR